MTYTPEEILLKIQAVSLIAQKAKKGVIPDYYPTYKLAVQNWKAIMVHANRDIFPEEVFSKRAPNQTEEASKWLRNNYKNVTQPFYSDFKDTIKQTFQESNWSIEYSDDDDVYLASENGFQEYVEESLNKYVSLEGFVRDLLPDLKIQDAMGLICVKPQYIPTVKNELDETVIAGDKLIEPIPYFYHCDKVVGYDDNNYFIVEMKEKSKLSDNSMTGRIYEFIDATNIVKATQNGNMADNTFDLEVTFNHNFGEVPARRAGGIPIMVENEILWISPFLFAVDLLDIISVVSAYLFAMTTKTAFPATIVVGNPCDFEDNGNQCNGGMIGVMGDGGYKYHQCPKCHGAGEVSRLGVFDTLILRPANRVDPNGQAEINSTQPPLQYVSPSVDILDFNERYITLRENKVRNILHLHTSNTSVKGSEDLTATGDSIDLKQKYAFIAPNAFQLFSHYEFLLNAIGWMRYGEKYNPPTLTYPASFDMESESDILASIVEMIKGGVPAIVVKANVSRYLKSIFFTDKEASKAFDLIMDTDRLLLLNNDEIALKLVKGLCADWEVILHDSSLTFIEQLEQANEKFFEQKPKIQQQQLIDLAKAKADEVRPDPIELPQQAEIFQTS